MSKLGKEKSFLTVNKTCLFWGKTFPLFQFVDILREISVLVSQYSTKAAAMLGNLQMLDARVFVVSCGRTSKKDCPTAVLEDVGAAVGL